MRIAMVNSYFYPEMIGGVEWYVYNMSRELVGRGHEVHVFAARSERLDMTDSVNSLTNGIHVHRIPLLLDLTYRFKIWRGLRKQLIDEKFDIIHTYDYAQCHSFIAALAGRKRRIPVAMTVFDIHSLIPRVLYKQIPMLVYDRFLSKWLFEAVDRILIRTPSIMTHVIGFGAPKGKILVTPSGIRREALEPANGQDFRRESRAIGPLILFLGRIHPTKGIQHLIKAAPSILSEIPDARIVLVGPDQIGYRKTLQRLASDLGLQDSIIHHDAIYDLSGKMQAYAACDVFVLPSAYEGFGQVLLEAMAQGRPIVTTNVGGIPSLIRNGREGLLIDYGDPKSLADAILRILSDEELAATMGKRGRCKASCFTYDVLARQLERIYLEMSEGGGLHPAQ